MVLETAIAYIFSSTYSWVLTAATAILIGMSILPAMRGKAAKVPVVPYPNTANDNINNYQDNQVVLSPDGTRINAFAPGSQKTLGTIDATQISSLPSVISRAREAHNTWKSTSNFGDRERLLRTLKAFILKNQNDICRASMQDTGKTYVGTSPIEPSSLFRLKNPQT
jgi:hypothetical protein